MIHADLIGMGKLLKNSRFAVQRQLLFPIGDNYFSLRTTFIAINC